MSLPPFVNEPILELRRPDARAALQAGMAALEPKLPLRVPLLIGEQRTEGDALASTDPGASDRVVALAPRVTPADASRALDVAGEAAPHWGATPAIDRAQSLVR
ncbi:MAG: RHH-type transcriptional regulator, proline utilization regulon repressor / proline dehydrogenase, partial [Solirubrobacteraceae bacterium]|nr:RHH-type transcriptional regulator, proline utilization regulon repressor / proline dehydrogenase [Solirubrobacteraceae bacterium]